MVRENFDFDPGSEVQKQDMEEYAQCLEAQKKNPNQKCTKPEFQSKDIQDLLKSAHDMCHDQSTMTKLRLRAFGSALGLGLANVIGAGGLLGRAKLAGYQAQADHGGLPDDETMVSNMKSSLEGMKWGTFQTLAETQKDISTDQYFYVQVIQKNADLQMKFMDNLVNYEITTLLYGEITIAIVIITILNYILRHL
jgi:uncharacterized protein YfaA (DUF2138 family)